MEVREARALLGVTAAADPAAVRDAYRRRMRAVHPDVAGAHRTGEAARVNEAYALLVRTARSRPGPVPPAARFPEQRTVGVVDREDGALLRLPWPPADAFGRVVEAGHALGEVTFIDRGGALLEVIVDVDGEACSLVCSFGRTTSGAVTVVEGTLESIERVATLDPSPVLRALASFIAADPTS